MLNAPRHRATTQDPTGVSGVPGHDRAALAGSHARAVIAASPPAAFPAPAREFQAPVHSLLARALGAVAEADAPIAPAVPTLPAAGRAGAWEELDTETLASLLLTSNLDTALTADPALALAMRLGKEIARSRLRPQDSAAASGAKMDGSLCSEHAHHAGASSLAFRAASSDSSDSGSASDDDSDGDSDDEPLDPGTTAMLGYGCVPSDEPARDEARGEADARCGAVALDCAVVPASHMPRNGSRPWLSRASDQPDHASAAPHAVKLSASAAASSQATNDAEGDHPRVSCANTRPAPAHAASSAVERGACPPVSAPAQPLGGGDLDVMGRDLTRSDAEEERIFDHRQGPQAWAPPSGARPQASRYGLGAAGPLMSSTRFGAGLGHAHPAYSDSAAAHSNSDDSDNPLHHGGNGESFGDCAWSRPRIMQSLPDGAEQARDPLERASGKPWLSSTDGRPVTAPDHVSAGASAEHIAGGEELIGQQSERIGRLMESMASHLVSPRRSDSTGTSVSDTVMAARGPAHPRKSTSAGDRAVERRCGAPPAHARPVLLPVPSTAHACMCREQLRRSNERRLGGAQTYASHSVLRSCVARRMFRACVGGCGAAAVTLAS
jgi:hypothetical protein